MQESEPTGHVVKIPLVWVDADDETVRFCNQVLFQMAGPDEFVLTMGHAVPPPILGSEEEQREQAERISFVPVKTHARFSLTRQRVEEMIAVLQTVLTAADKAADTPSEP